MSAARTATSIAFGTQGDAARRTAVGWSFPEQGFTWTMGEESMILLDRPQEAGDYLLQVTCNPALHPGVPVQRVYVLVNRWYAGKQILDNYGTFEVRIGWDVMRDHRQVSITLLLPDAYRPCDVSESSDTRMIALAVFNISMVRLRDGTPATSRILPPAARVAGSGAATFPASISTGVTQGASAPVTTMPVISTAVLSTPPGSANAAFAAEFAALSVVKEARAPGLNGAPLDEQMLEFESIGADAEFGLVQRHVGAEPLGLLRFVEAPLERIIAGLDAGFEGIGAPGSVDIALRGREFMITEKRFGLTWHSWTHEGQANPRQVQDRETQRLDFLRSKLLQDLSGGHKLLVYKREAPLSAAEVADLLRAIRRHGPSHLLIVETADGDHPAGSVETEAPGLLRGYVSRFAPAENGEDVAVDSWLAMAREAHRVWQAAFEG